MSVLISVLHTLWFRAEKSKLQKLMFMKGIYILGLFIFLYWRSQQNNPVPKKKTEKNTTKNTENNLKVFENGLQNSPLNFC